jgi:RNA polymerase sigma-70 factor (ECF subfamily)
MVIGFETNRDIYMFEDKLLVWKFKRGSSNALKLIYEKYKNDLFALALTLSNDKASAEDIVHEVFVAFAQLADNFKLKGNLKSYLSTAVANRVRNMGRKKAVQTLQLEGVEIAGAVSNQPDRLMMSREQSQQIDSALAELPYQQREVIILHLQSGLRFKDIASDQQVSVNTIQSQYRYGLNKLRLVLDGEVEK